MAMAFKGQKLDASTVNSGTIVDSNDLGCCHCTKIPKCSRSGTLPRYTMLAAMRDSTNNRVYGSFVKSLLGSSRSLEIFSGSGI